SLQDRLGQGPLTPVAAARLGREVLAALRAAHEVGIQHRDVKPANVLLRPDQRPVLTDFGIAAIRESTVLTAAGSIIGTPDYMAPERIAGGEGGPASDLWSLAMMLYVAVEGRHPLRRGTTLATLAALLSEELPPPRQAGVLTGFLKAVLVKDPAARADAETADRMLAAASREQDATLFASRANAESTSYWLAPLLSPTPTHVPGITPAADFGPPMGFGPSTTYDAVPGLMVPPSVGPVGPTRPMRARGGRGAKVSVAVASSVIGTVLVGVLVWTLLPGGANMDHGEAAGSSDSSTSRTQNPNSSPSRPPQSASAPQIDTKTNLLTPDGIRTAIQAIETETGTNQACDLTVYPGYVSAEIMVKGSRTKYDSYTYRPGEKVEKGIISGSIVGGDRPFSLSSFDWDVVPALLKRAQKDLNVSRPTMRYILVRPANDTFGTPLELAVYRVDDHVTGYLTADLKGKVTRVMPAQD
ncbi:protein kinase, partial [Streptomyces sp. NPDC060085]|uniref:protein kinase domain-containing protein n=1 Tax=Streptomyces sp. NPDC060085 TaxID=3347054 RepID=UPI00365FEA78